MLGVSDAFLCFVVSCRNSIIDIVNKIIYLQSANNYTDIFLEGGGKITASRTLKEFEVLLNELGFLRIHNQSLINLSHTQSYQRGDGGVVTLTDGYEIAVSRSRKQIFLRHFKNLF